MRKGLEAEEQGADAGGFQELIEAAQVHYRTVGDMVYSVLRQAILSAVFAPGERLRQDNIAESMGVSRIPVRSALLQLESEGLVTYYPHSGAVVTSLTPEQVNELYQIRIVLESHLLVQAIASITPERLKELEELAAELDAEAPGERFLELRSAFYRKLYDADQHPMSVNLVERLRSDVGRYWAGLRKVEDVEHGHGEVLEYVRRRDANGAVRWLEAHLSSVRDKLLSLMLIKRGAGSKA